MKKNNSDELLKGISGIASELLFTLLIGALGFLIVLISWMTKL